MAEPFKVDPEIARLRRLLRAYYVQHCNVNEDRRCTCDLCKMVRSRDKKNADLAFERLRSVRYLGKGFMEMADTDTEAANG